MNVAALHLLKNREAKSNAEFFRLDETRRMGESGQDVAARGGGGGVCPGGGRSRVTTLLVTVLAPLNRAVNTAVGTGAAGATAAALAVAPGDPLAAGAVVTGVAVPGAKRRGGSGGGCTFDRLDMLHARLGFALCSPGHLTITRSCWGAFCQAIG